MITDEKFWSKVNKTDTCWLWTGATFRGYGHHWSNGKSHHAYKLLYESIHGKTPAKMQLDHLCRVRSCVNPDHLQQLRETLTELLNTYGNYSTLKDDWDKFDGKEQFEIFGGNAKMRDIAVDQLMQAITATIEAEVARDKVVELESLIKGQPVTNFTKHIQARANKLKLQAAQQQPSGEDKGMNISSGIM